MNRPILLRALLSILLIGLAAGCGNETKTEASVQTAPELLNKMRLKQLTEKLGLTDEQQQQAKELFAEETALIVKWDSEGSLSLAERTVRVNEPKKGSMEKIKALLTPEQLATLEESLAAQAKRKRTR